MGDTRVNERGFLRTPDFQRLDRGDAQNKECGNNKRLHIQVSQRGCFRSRFGGPRRDGWRTEEYRAIAILIRGWQ